jgi:arabinose-5-phosphate isomerase
MGTGERIPRVRLDASVREALFEITSKGYGATAIVGEDEMIRGVFTDGDLRRLLEDRGVKGLELPIAEVMSRDPLTIAPEKLAAEAIHIMEEKEISCLLVEDQGRLSGIVHIHELLKAGVA